MQLTPFRALSLSASHSFRGRRGQWDKPTLQLDKLTCDAGLTHQGESELHYFSLSLHHNFLIFLRNWEWSSTAEGTGTMVAMMYCWSLVIVTHG